MEDKINKIWYQMNMKEITSEEARQQVLDLFNTSGSLLPDVDYWKQRCLLAEKCLEESPCDSDITSGQIMAWNAYRKFISLVGNDR